MQSDYTHISVILDRSGSMEAIRDDIIGGFNADIARQQAQPGQATLTLVQFDHQDPYEVVHQFRALASVPRLDCETFVPRGRTPLLDAMGRGINDIDVQIRKLAEAARPEKVMVVIITDGQENARSEFSKAQVEKLIKEKQDGLGWQFLFLSADMNSIGMARGMGIRVADSASFGLSSDEIFSSFDYVSLRSSDFRSSPRKPAPDPTPPDDSPA